MTKPKVLLTRKLHDFAVKELKKHYSIQVHSGKIPMPKKKLMQKIKDKDGLICFPYDVIDKDVIDSAKKLRAIFFRVSTVELPMCGAKTTFCIFC